MVGPAVCALPQHWTELCAARRQKRWCSEDIAALKDECACYCGKAQVAECASCYGKVLDRLLARYASSQDQEWFTPRKAFLSALPELFEEVKEGRTSLVALEARIEAEKEAWYREVLRRCLDFITLSQLHASHDDLKEMLDQPEQPREQLVEAMMQAVGVPEGWPTSVESFATKAASVSHDLAALKDLYAAEFFLDRSSREVLRCAQGYLEAFRSNDAVCLEAVIDEIAGAIKGSRNAQPQREIHVRRLGEVRRAKKAFEQNKAQAKRQRAEQRRKCSEYLRQLPPCQSCGEDTSKVAEVFSCIICQAARQWDSSKKLAVYCDEACFRKGHEVHIDAEHACGASGQCMRARGDETGTDDGTWRAVLCEACLTAKKFTLYCTEVCASRHIAGHLREVHGIAIPGIPGPSFTTRAQAVVDAALREEKTGLKMRQMS